MRFDRLFSRRAAVALVMALGLSALLGGSAEAAKKAPNIKGQWQGTLFAEGFEPTPYILNITSQKKNGKFSGQANFVGFPQVSLTGKIQPNRKVKGSFSGDINNEPIVFTVKVTVARDGQSADGTFTGKDEDGNVVVTGTTTLERVPEDK